MLKHVLVPLDGSQLAEDALEHAVNILEPQGKITLVAAIEVPEIPVYGYFTTASTADFDTATRDALPQARTYLEGIASRYTELHVTFAADAQLGEAADVIAEAAQKHKVDAIVMSTHGRSGLSRWLFGSVTNKVLSAQPCPVYVIPSKSKSNDIRHKVQ